MKFKLTKDQMRMARRKREETKEMIQELKESTKRDMKKVQG